MISVETLKAIANHVESACDIDVKCRAILKTEGLYVRMTRFGDFNRELNRLIRYEELENEASAGYLVEEAISRMRRELGLK